MARLKEKRLVALLGVGLLWAVSARADDRIDDRMSRVVVVADGAGSSEGFANTLSIQLLGAAEVEKRALPAAPSVGERVRAARELGQREQALLVVWAEGPLDLPDGGKESLLYAIGQREGRALLEVVRIPGGQGPDMDRTLALKVRDMVDELKRLRAQPQRDAEEADDAALIAPPAPRAAALRMLFGLDAVARAQQGTAFGQWGAALALGPLLTLGEVRIAGLAELRFLPPLTLERGGAQLRFDELAPWLSVRSQMHIASLWLGAQSGLGLGFTQIEGRTTQGTRGTSSAHVFAWRVGLDAELPLGAGLGFAVGIELQTNFRRQRYTVNGRQAIDFGRFVPLATLGLRLRI